MRHRANFQRTAETSMSLEIVGDLREELHEFHLFILVFSTDTLCLEASYLCNYAMTSDREIKRYKV